MTENGNKIFSAIIFFTNLYPIQDQTVTQDIGFNEVVLYINGKSCLCGYIGKMLTVNS